MSFMVPEVIYTTMLHVETTCGSEMVLGELIGASRAPTAADLSDYLVGEPVLDGGGLPQLEVKTGWYARLSAPGYLDCTDWTGPATTESGAYRELAELHDVCGACFEPCFDSDNPCDEI